MNKRKMTTNGKGAFVDVVCFTHDDETYVASFYNKGYRMWTKPTAIKKRENVALEQLAALYVALSKLTRNAIVQLHGFDKIEKSIFKASHTGNKVAWDTIKAVELIGINGNHIDIISVNDRVNPNIDGADKSKWEMANREANIRLVQTCISKNALAARG